MIPSKLTPKLTPGLALLWHGEKWVEAITDEVARDTCKFLYWDPKSGIRVLRRGQSVGKSPVEWKQFAHYEDASGRRWVQRSYAGGGIMQPMIVKVELQIDAKASVCMISNKDGSLRMTVAATAPLMARMQGAAKRFFDAEVMSSAIELGETKPDQDW